MCKAYSTSGRSSSSHQPSPSAWYSLFLRECLKRGVEPTALVGGQLASLIAQDATSMPPLRTRERAWMQLLAHDPEPKTPSIYTATAERLDEPQPVRRRIKSRRSDASQF